MESARTLIWVILGSGLGGGLRFLLSTWVDKQVGQPFPWGTLGVNVIGSFAIGLLFFMTDVEGKWALHPDLRQFFLVGVLGGFTTFSTFSLQTLHVMRSGDWHLVFMNIFLSLLLCLGACWAGYLLAHLANHSAK